MIKLPRVLGQLAAGFILGIPIIKSNLVDYQIESIFSFIANIGIIMLFFFIGLEINLKRFKKNIKQEVLVAVFNTIIPLTLGFLVSYYFFGFSMIISLIIGISLAVSSQTLSIDILEECRLIKSKIGNRIISTGVIDDVFELFLISILLTIFSSEIGRISFLNLIFDILLFMIMIFTFKIIIIPLILRLFEKEKSPTSLFMGAFIIVLLMAYLSEYLGMSSLIGALFAGMLVRHALLVGEHKRPWEEHEIAKSIHVIAFGFLIPIFFVWIGMNTDFSALFSHFWFVIILFVISVGGTLVGTMIGVLLSKGSFLEANIIGWGVVPKGDTELVIVTLALSAGIITNFVFSAIIVMAFLTTLTAPIVFRYLLAKYKTRLKVL